VPPRRVAPAAVVAGEVPVGRAEVGAGDDDGRRTRVAPPGADAPQLVALPAPGAAREQRRAQRRRARRVERQDVVGAVAARAACIPMMSI